MIRMNQVKLPIEHSEEALGNKVGKLLKVDPKEIISLEIIKQSVDARKKEELLFIYSLYVELKQEDMVLKRVKSPDIFLEEKKRYVFPEKGDQKLDNPPIVIGSGPAGLFCALMLARAGYKPIVLERGEDVDTRTEQVRCFWEGGPLNLNSNVQFGEGGAGTFSDGKLNTLVKDSFLRNGKVLEILVEFGADPSIVYKNKPHIGTDVLCGIVKNIRKEIIRFGGQVCFGSLVTDFLVEDDKVCGVVVNGTQRLRSDIVVLAIGHSARDTFELLYEKGVSMEKKAFAVGLRIQHAQSMINQAQYGKEDICLLGAAEYKLTRQVSTNRGVYSFCMCPGGYVVNSSSESGALVVNGMSNHARDSKSANSALIVTVTPEDFKSDTPLAGVEFQRELERNAYQILNGKIPIQLYGDFKENRESTQLKSVEPEIKGEYGWANLRSILPEVVSESIIEAIEGFGKVIKGFDSKDAILAGVESRTSSPVRIHRGEELESSLKGLYPCGEGAGYAGGITSAAMDGLKVAERIASKFYF